MSLYFMIFEAVLNFFLYEAGYKYTYKYIHKNPYKCRQITYKENIFVHSIIKTVMVKINIILTLC